MNVTVETHAANATFWPRLQALVGIAKSNRERFIGVFEKDVAALAAIAPADAPAGTVSSGMSPAQRTEAQHFLRRGRTALANAKKHAHCYAHDVPASFDAWVLHTQFRKSLNTGTKPTEELNGAPVSVFPTGDHVSCNMPWGIGLLVGMLHACVEQTEDSWDAWVASHGTDVVCFPSASKDAPVCVDVLAPPTPAAYLVHLLYAWTVTDGVDARTHPSALAAPTLKDSAAFNAWVDEILSDFPELMPATVPLESQPSAPVAGITPLDYTHFKTRPLQHPNAAAHLASMTEVFAAMQYPSLWNFNQVPAVSRIPFWENVTDIRSQSARLKIAEILVKVSPRVAAAAFDRKTLTNNTKTLRFPSGVLFSTDGEGVVFPMTTMPGTASGTAAATLNMRKHRALVKIDQLSFQSPTNSWHKIPGRDRAQANAVYHGILNPAIYETSSASADVAFDLLKRIEHTTGSPYTMYDSMHSQPEKIM